MRTARQKIASKTTRIKKETSGHTASMTAYKQIKEFYKDLVQKRYSTLAGTLVFFLLMSIVPISFLVVLIFGAIGLDPSVLVRVPGLSRFSGAFETLYSAAQRAGSGATVFLVLSSLYSSANFFYHMRRSGEIIYNHIRPKRGLIVRLSAFIMLLVLLLLLILLIAAVTLGEAIIGLLGVGFLSRVGLYALLLAVGVILLTLVNLYVAPVRPRIKAGVVGAVFTLVWWTVATLGLNVYLNFFGYEKLYGGLATVVVLMLWLYLLMLGMTAGFVLAKRKGTQKIPKTVELENQKRKNFVKRQKNG